jgi:hypothetical protein
MKTAILTMWCAAFLVVAGLSPALAAGPSLGQVVDGVDGRKNTKLATKENWKKFKGQEVSWSGVVHDVDSKGSDEAKIYVADKSRPLYKGYNITLITREIGKASNLKRGQTIRFKGTIDGFDSKDSGAVIELKEVHLP